MCMMATYRLHGLALHSVSVLTLGQGRTLTTLHVLHSCYSRRSAGLAEIQVASGRLPVTKRNHRSPFLEHHLVETFVCQLSIYIMVRTDVAVMKDLFCDNEHDDYTILWFNVPTVWLTTRKGFIWFTITVVPEIDFLVRPLHVASHKSPLFLLFLRVPSSILRMVRSLSVFQFTVSKALSETLTIGAVWNVLCWDHGGTQPNFWCDNWQGPMLSFLRVSHNSLEKCTYAATFLLFQITLSEENGTFAADFLCFHFTVTKSHGMKLYYWSCLIFLCWDLDITQLCFWCDDWLPWTKAEMFCSAPPRTFLPNTPFSLVPLCFPRQSGKWHVRCDLPVFQLRFPKPTDEAFSLELSDFDITQFCAMIANVNHYWCPNLTSNRFVYRPGW